MNEQSAPICVIVDGQCPICALYARHLDAATDPAHVRTIDGRLASAEKSAAQGYGFDLDAGFVALTPDGPIGGRDAMIWLSRNLDPGASWLLRLGARLFRYELPAAIAYPLFKAIRRVALRWKGVGRLT